MTHPAVRSAGPRAMRVAVTLLAVSLVLLFIASARSPLGAASSGYAALVNQAELLVHAAAHDGVGMLGSPERKSAVEQLTTRPLAPLLSAWSALSFGRMGVLDSSSCVRLPWLILAGALPVAVFGVLLDLGGLPTAIGAAVWLLLSPGFVASALAVRPAALAAWSSWLVLAPYAMSLAARGGRARCTTLAACGTCFVLALGLDFAVLGLIPLLFAHFWIARRGEAARLAASGHSLAPVGLLVMIVAVPVALAAFDPVLWHANAPGAIRRLASDDVLTLERPPRLVPFIASGVLGLCGLATLARRGLARRFATGEFRPPRDRARTGLLLTLGLLATLGYALSGGAARLEFAADLARPLLACVVAIGASSVAARWFAARHARIAEAALLLLVLLVR